MASQDELQIQLDSVAAQLTMLDADIESAVDQRASLNDKLNDINNQLVDLEQKRSTADLATQLLLEPTRRSLLIQASSAESELRAVRSKISSLQSQQQSLTTEQQSIERSIAALSPESTVKTTDSVNIPASDVETDNKYADSSVVTTMPDPESADNSADTQTPARSLSVSEFLNTNSLKSAFSPRAVPSADPKKIEPAYPTINKTVDRRVRIKVPTSYLVGQSAGPNGEITKNGGIAFPYTPTVSASHSANYTTFSASHSNYTQYFYKNSSVSDITITGKFSVQNETEAGILLGTIHLLRCLTKMKFGDDQNAGSPPPVCRLFAFGTYMFDNTPVAVKEFRIDLPADVDYIDAGPVAKLYGNSMVPTMSTINVTLIPLYSRQEMLSGTVSGWLTKDQRSKGYL